jgi:hypothetical protein
MDGSGVDFTVIGRPVDRQTPFYKGVWGVKMSADVTHWRFTAVLVADTEWNECRASVMFEAVGYWGSGSTGSSVLRLLQVSGASSVRYLLGSVTSTLTTALTSSGTYTQPLGSDGFFDPEAFSDDARELLAVVVGRRNCSGIFVVFEGAEEVSCQRCGLRTIEVNSRHAVGLKGPPQWESRWEVE